MAIRLQKRTQALSSKSTAGVQQGIQDSFSLNDLTFGTQDLASTIIATAADSHFIDTNKLKVIINNVRTIAYDLFPFLIIDTEDVGTGVYDEHEDSTSCDEDVHAEDAHHQNNPN